MAQFRSQTDEQLAARSGWDNEYPSTMWWELGVTPRPPVNRVLTAFRSGNPTNDQYELLSILESQWATQFTTAEIEHARAVIEKWLHA